MGNWEEIKSAYKVASLGTVSAAADVLGVHRATIIRHIDSLEGFLGQKLFLRHANGYTTTPTGEELVRIGKLTEEHFNQWIDQAKGNAAQESDELIITSKEFLSPLIMPILSKFNRQNPNIQTKYLTSEDVLRLEYGEAHISILPGPKPDNLNHVVHPFLTYKVGLYASPDYISRKGLPKTNEDFQDHSFIGRSKPMTPFEFWLRNLVPEKNYIFKTESPLVMHQALVSGEGIGFMPEHKTQDHPDLIEVIPRMTEWDVPIWSMTHTDMHKSEKVQAFFDIIKEHNIAGLGAS